MHDTLCVRQSDHPLRHLQPGDAVRPLSDELPVRSTCVKVRSLLYLILPSSLRSKSLLRASRSLNMAPSLANVEILPAQPQLHVSPARSPSANSLDDLKDDKVDAYGKSETTYDKSETTSLSSRAPLAPRADIASHSAGAAILRLLGVRKRSAFDDPDAVATQESVYDGPLAAAYAPSDEWENKAAFDPSFRWTNREEKALKRKLDIKIFLWVAIMFLALDIDRANLANATADNLLKDLGLTHGEYVLALLL